MSSWRKVRLSEVAFFQEGPGLRRWQWTDSGMKVINGTNVLPNGDFDVANTDRFISLDEFHRKYRHFAIEADDVVVVSSGSIGKVSRVRAEHLPLMMNTSVVRFRPLDPTVLDADFLFGFLRSPLFREQAAGLATGTAQLNFGPSHIAQMSMPLPPIGEQRRIGAVLRAMDDLIQNNRRRIALLEQMAQGIYREWFVYFRYPGCENEELVDSPLGPIPKGWSAVEMQDVCEIVDCLHSKKPREHEDGFGMLLQLFNIASAGRLDLSKRFLISEKDYRQWTSRIEVREGDCIVTNVGRVGAVAQLPSGVKAAIGRNMTAVRPRAGLMTPTYLIEYFLSPHMERELAVKTDVGTIMDALNVKSIVRLVMPVPPADLLQSFEYVTRPARRLADVLTLETQSVQGLRDILLPKLMTGAIDISKLDVDAFIEESAA